MGYQELQPTPADLPPNPGISAGVIDAGMPGRATNPPSPTAIRTEAIARENEYRTRIVQALSGMAERPDIGTELKGYLTSYIRFASPSIAAMNSVDFPVTVRQHPIHRDSCRNSGRFEDILMYHVGATLIDYYALVRKPTGMRDEEANRLEVRLRLIEGVATGGPHAYVVTGSDVRGWRLILLSNVERTPEIEFDTVDPDKRRKIGESNEEYRDRVERMMETGGTD